MKTESNHLFCVQYEGEVRYVVIDKCNFEKARQVADAEDYYQDNPPDSITYLGLCQVEIQNAS